MKYTRMGGLLLFIFLFLVGCSPKIVGVDGVIDEARGSLNEDPNISVNTEITVDSFDKLNNKLGESKLSKNQIGEIDGFDDAKSQISTLSDAIYYFQTLPYKNFSFMGFKASDGNNNIITKTEHIFDFDRIVSCIKKDNQIGFNIAQLMITYLLSDDFNECGNIYGFEKTYAPESDPIFGSYFKIDGLFNILIIKNLVCFNDCAIDYGGVVFQYIVTDDLINVVNVNQGRNGSGLFALVKDSATPNTTVLVSADTFNTNGTGKTIYVDLSYFKNYDPGESAGSYPISAYKIPNELATKNITNNRANELRFEDFEIAKKEINSLRDLFVYLIINNYTTQQKDLVYLDENNEFDWHYNRAAEKVFKDGYLNCGGGSNLARYLLDGDYDEIGYVNYTYLDGYGGGHVTNYIKEGDKYYFFDLIELCGNSYYPENVHIDTCSSFEEFSEIITKRNDRIKLIYTSSQYKDGYDIPVFWGNSTIDTYVPTGTNYNLIYSSDGYSIKEKDMNLKINRYGVPLRNNEDINYKFSDKQVILELGEAKLTINELKLLSNSSIEEVKNKVSTLADLLNLMYYRGMENFENDLNLIEERYNWQFNRNAKTVYRSNGGDCGGLSNFANYILGGDYDEEGFINYTFSLDNGGGHVTNYVKKNNMYYFFDLTSWFGGQYSVNFFECLKYDSLQAFAEDGKFYFNSVTNNMCSYIADNDLPVNWYKLEDGITYYPSIYKLNILREINGYKYVGVDITDNGMKHINTVRG